MAASVGRVFSGYTGHDDPSALHRQFEGAESDNVRVDRNATGRGMSRQRLTFIVPVTRDEVLARNVLASKVYRDGFHQFIFQRGYTNVPKAYNDAVARAEGNILVFCHQDVFYPDAWEDAFLASLDAVETLDPHWGVLGVAGVRLKRRWFGLRQGVEFLGNFSTNVAGGAHVIDHFRPRRYPQTVHTLDEFILVVHKRHAAFDERVPNNHFYGADICLAQAAQGRHSYVVSAYMHHDSASKWVYADFYESAAYMYAKYRQQLPIATTCVVIEERAGEPRFSQDFVALLAMTVHSALRFPKRVRKPRFSASSG